MSEPESTEPPRDDVERDAATPREGSDRDTPDRSDTGVGLGSGEPNTFEPEEAAPPTETPPE